VLGRNRAARPSPEEGDAPATGRLALFLAALRRFVVLLVAAGGLILLFAVPAGLILDTPVRRAVAIGFYLVGCFLLVAGFFVGNRGPARTGSEETTATAGLFGIGIGARGLRWATREEQEDALNHSAVFVAIGFALILIGVAFDTRYHL
jgi:hypothetical protein